MHRRSLLSFALVTATMFVGSSLAAAQSRAPRIQPIAGSPIPGARVHWSITPNTLAFDSQYAPAAMRTTPDGGMVGFPAPLVPVRITMHIHNDTARSLFVGDGHGDGRHWQLVLNGPGALRVENHSNCRLLEIVRLPRLIEVPAHGDAEITLDGLTTGGSCPDDAWFWTSPGRYAVQGSLHTTYTFGARPSDATAGTPVVFEIPSLSIDVR